MNQSFILLLLICFYQVYKVDSVFQMKDNNYYVIRNNILKNIILSDIQRAKNLIKSTMLIYNRALSKYYELNEKYYSLSENDKILLETILSLTY